jgi:hypothetical protein
MLKLEKKNTELAHIIQNCFPYLRIIACKGSVLRSRKCFLRLNFVRDLTVVFIFDENNQNTKK